VTGQHRPYSGSRSGTGPFIGGPKSATWRISAAAATGIGDVGLVLATMDRIADGDRQSWFDAWTGTARELAAPGRTAAAAGNTRTASWALRGPDHHPAADPGPAGRAVLDGQPTGRRMTSTRMLDFLATHLPSRS
jgi:hypothetical protein